MKISLIMCIIVEAELQITFTVFRMSQLMPKNLGKKKPILIFKNSYFFRYFPQNIFEFA
jgi:hypothetical protein